MDERSPATSRLSELSKLVRQRTLHGAGADKSARSRPGNRWHNAVAVVCKTIPWATFIGPEFFTLSTNKAQSDRVIARFRVLGGKVTEVPLLRGRLFPKDQDPGILTAEDGHLGHH